MRILIYQNPDAGHERPRPDTLIESLQREGHDVEWRHIKQHRLSDPDTGPLDLVVAVGGDGSVGRTARQLIGGDLPIAVLPMGTANNLATVLDAGAHDLAERIAAWSSVPLRCRHARGLWRARLVLRRPGCGRVRGHGGAAHQRSPFGTAPAFTGGRAGA